MPRIHPSVENVAQALLEALRIRGIDYVFGNASTSMLDGFARAAANGIAAPKPVIVPHEQVAIAIAHGVYASTGRIQAACIYSTVGTANAQSTKLSVDAYGGPEFRLAEQNFAKFAEALTKINQPLVPQFLMSGGQGQEGNNAGLIPTAMLSSMFGRMMPDALEKLKDEAPKAARRTNGQ